MAKKQDPKLLSSGQKWEPARVARKYKIPVSVVRETALEVGKNGNPTRSLDKVYKALEAKGYKVGGVPKVPDAASEPIPVAG